MLKIFGNFYCCSILKIQRYTTTHLYVRATFTYRFIYTAGYYQIEFFVVTMMHAAA